MMGPLLKICMIASLMTWLSWTPVMAQTSSGGGPDGIHHNSFGPTIFDARALSLLKTIRTSWGRCVPFEISDRIGPLLCQNLLDTISIIVATSELTRGSSSSGWWPHKGRASCGGDPSLDLKDLCPMATDKLNQELKAFLEISNFQKDVSFWCGGDIHAQSFREILEQFILFNHRQDQD